MYVAGRSCHVLLWNAFIFYYALWCGVINQMCVCCHHIVVVAHLFISKIREFIHASCICMLCSKRANTRRFRESTVGLRWERESERESEKRGSISGLCRSVNMKKIKSVYMSNKMFNDFTWWNKENTYWNFFHDYVRKFISTFLLPFIFIFLIRFFTSMYLVEIDIQVSFKG